MWMMMIVMMMMVIWMVMLIIRTMMIIVKIELNYNNFIGFNVNHHLPDQGLVGNNPQVY